MLEMHFYVVKTKEGIYHVQNAVVNFPALKGGA